MNEDMEKMLQEAPAPTLTLEPFTEEKEEPAVVEKEEAVQPVDEKEKIFEMVDRGGISGFHCRSGNICIYAV